MSEPRNSVMHDDPHLLDSLGFLQRRWRIVLGVFVGFVVVAAALAYRVDPVYQAMTRILVGATPQRGVLSDRASAIEGYLLEQRSFETQLEIMRSQPVIEGAGILLGRIDDESPVERRDALLASLRARTQVERVRDTRIVLLRVTHPDPAIARDMANAMAESYIDYSQEQRSAAQRRSVAWLTSETEAVRDSLRRSEERLIEYIQVEKLDFAGTVGDGPAATDPAQAALRERIAHAEVELRQLRRRYRSLHPKVQELEAQLVSLRAGLDAEQAQRTADHHKWIQYRILKRDVELEQELYQVLLKKLKEADLEEDGAGGNIRILETAKLPRVAVGPAALRALVIAAVLGLCFGLALAYAVEVFDRTAATPDDIQRVLGLPTLGVLREFEGESRRLVAEASSGLIGESFRSLRTNLRFSHVDRPRRVVLVTSTGPEEGKSTVLANLGVSLAQSGRRTLLIDTDLRRPSLYRFFGMGEGTGLADVLAGDASLESAVCASRIEHLDVLPAGTRPPNPAELIESRRLQELIVGLREDYEYVLLDSPPAGGLIDSSLLCGLVDGVLFVVERGRFDLKIVKTALRQLERSGGRLYGVVLNKAPVDERSMLYGYYQYGVEDPASDGAAAGAG
ncbi:MAG: polysaccharide biosynthesis tyrosine autokinase [Myxococcota bacterium]